MFDRLCPVPQNKSVFHCSSHVKAIDFFSWWVSMKPRVTTPATKEKKNIACELVDQPSGAWTTSIMVGRRPQGSMEPTMMEDVVLA